MRTFMVISLVLSQFTILPFFGQLASAREQKLTVIQSGMNVVYKTSDEWPAWLKDRWSHKL